MEVIGISVSEGLVLALVALIVLGPKQIQQLISGLKRMLVAARTLSAKARVRMSQEIATETKSVTELGKQFEKSWSPDTLSVTEKPSREIKYFLDEIDLRRQIQQMVASEMEQWANLMSSAPANLNAREYPHTSDIIQTTPKLKENA